MGYEIKRENDKIFFYFDYEGCHKIGYCDFNEELWKIINFSSWYATKTNGEYKYIRSGKYEKSLHEIVMEYIYGYQICEEMKNEKYVIDHIDNNGFNCLSQNLYFLNKEKNWHYKGNYYDKLRKRKVLLASLQIFANHDTKEFQITIGFNVPFVNPVTKQSINSMWLLYKNNDYDLVLLDALRILETLDNRGIDLNELHFSEMKVEDAVFLNSSPDSNLKPKNVIRINGQTYMVMGNGCWIDSKAPDKTLWQFSES